MESLTVPRWRLWLLRALYLLIAAGLAAMIGPGILFHDASWPHARGVVHALLGAVMVLSAVGLFRPLQMLPILLFELVWKTIWLVVFALPLYRADAMTAATRASVGDCLPAVVILPLVLPWGYMWKRYVRGQ